MVYVCGNCRFIFERTGEILSCPDCNKPDIREASVDEENEFRKTRAEFYKSKHNNAAK